MTVLKRSFLILMMFVLILPAFSRGSKEKESDEAFVKILSVEVEGSVFTFETESDEGRIVIYKAGPDTKSSYPVSSLKPGDYIAVRDSGIETLSLPPQRNAVEIRMLNPSVALGASDSISGSSLNNPGISIGFGVPDESDYISSFSYAYGYFTMEGLKSEGIIPNGSYFARGIYDAAGIETISPLLSFEDMNASIDDFISDFIENGEGTYRVDLMATKERILSLPAPESLSDRFSYSYGYFASLNTSYNGIEFYPDELIAGLLTSLYGLDSLYTEDEMLSFLDDYIAKLEEEYYAYIAMLGEHNLTLAEAYLEDNLNKEGVAVVADGVQIEFLERGDGNENPTDESIVTLDYRLYSADGTTYDMGEDSSFVLSFVIPGFREAVKNMVVGDRVRAVIHPAMGYGELGAGNIEPNMLLIFDIKLKSIDS